MAYISVLVVACTDAAPPPLPVSTPTPRPVAITLQGPSGTPPITPRPTLVAVTATPAEPDPAPVEILPPVCSDTLRDGYQCVGVARNTASTAHGTVMLHAELFHGGEVVETQVLALEQRLVSPDATTPYRVLFERNAEGPLVLRLSDTFAPDRRLVSLSAENVSGSYDGGVYTITARLVNNHDLAVSRIRAVAAVYDGDDLIGYRVAEFGTLDTGETAAVEIRWHGVQRRGDVRYTLAADGFAADIPAAETGD